MPTIIWEVTKKIWCDRVKKEVDLLEERVYPDEPVPDVGKPFQVLARKCPLGVECNLIGFACRWSGLNPNYDPFVEAP